MFHGKCGFCRQPGHNVTMCNHPDKQYIIQQMEETLDNCESKNEIWQYLNTLSPIRLQILASTLRLNSGTPKVFMKNKLVDYYYNRVLIRDARIARHNREIDETRTEYSRYMPLPYSLFQSCIHNIQQFGSEVCIAISTIRRRLSNVQTETETHSLTQETYLFQRGWKIIPELSVDTFNYKEKKECPICFEHKSQKDYVVPLCKHGVCVSCFVHFVDNGSVIKAPLCPMCREVVKTVDVYTVDTYNTITNKYVCDL